MNSQTWIIDIDGTLLHNLSEGMSAQLDAFSGEALTGAVGFLDELHARGHFILLVTARPESHRAETELQLKRFGLFWNVLVMGLPKGARVVLNDVKPGGTSMSFSTNVARNWSPNIKLIDEIAQRAERRSFAPDFEKMLFQLCGGKDAKVRANTEKVDDRTERSDNQRRHVKTVQDGQSHDRSQRHEQGGNRRTSNTHVDASTGKRSKPSQPVKASRKRTK